MREKQLHFLTWLWHVSLHQSNTFTLRWERATLLSSPGMTRRKTCLVKALQGFPQCITSPVGCRAELGPPPGQSIERNEFLAWMQERGAGESADFSNNKVQVSLSATHSELSYCQNVSFSLILNNNCSSWSCIIKAIVNNLVAYF